MKKLYLTLSLISSLFCLQAQNYEFQTVSELTNTPVISQGATGTCWSFSTSSFLESEITRLTGKTIDLSEMYQVRNTYPKKAENYVMRQGKAQFSEGGLTHDVLKSAEKYGLVPASVYTGLSEEEKNHNHGELVSVLEAMVKTYIENPSKKLSPKWKDAIHAVLDIYLGKNPDNFEYEGKKYTPMSFMNEMKIDPKAYLTITSFTHEDYYKPFILNIPDNFSNGSMYNLPLDEFIEVIDQALQNGFTLALDSDVSESTFSAKEGIAVIPLLKEDNKKSLKEIVTELNVTPAIRQAEFENFNTTDDHLMHIVGKVKDQNGNIYYKVKNSWGTDKNRVANGGYVYMSIAYIKLKAISITLHRDALSKGILKKLQL